MLDNRTVGSTIAKLRLSLGYTQQELAERMSVSHQAVSKWETGAALPDMQTMLALSRLFEVSIEEILTGQLVQDAEEETDVVEYDVVQERAEPEASADVTEDDPAEEAEEEDAPSRKSEPLYTLESIIALAPFASKKKLGEMIGHIEEEMDFHKVQPLLPFLSHETIDALIFDNARPLTIEELVSLAPFAHRETLNTLVRDAMDQIGEVALQHVRALAPFLGSEAVDHLIDRAQQGAGEDLKERVKKRTPAPNEPMQAQGLSAKQRVMQKAIENQNWDWVEDHAEDMTKSQRRALFDTILATRNWGFLEDLGDYMDRSWLEEALDQCIREDQWDAIETLTEILD